MEDENISFERNFDSLPSEMDSCGGAALKTEGTFDEDEYDDDVISAPIEVLAEFLSAVMSRDYKDALHYCKIILQYEPDNKTARDFYPLIEEKLQLEMRCKNNNEGESDENDSYSGIDNGKNSSCSLSSSNSDVDNDEIMDDNTPELSHELQKISIQ